MFTPSVMDNMDNLDMEMLILGNEGNVCSNCVFQCCKYYSQTKCIIKVVQSLIFIFFLFHNKVGYIYHHSLRT